MKYLSLRLNGSVHKVSVTKLYSVSALYFLFFFALLYFFIVDWDIFFTVEKISLCVCLICLTLLFHTAPQGAVSSIWTHSHKDTKHTLTPAGSLRCFIYLYFRPPDRRRRDVFGVANNTLFHEGGGRGNTTLGTGDNSTDGIPPIKEYPFSEDKSPAEYLEIPHLRPFTVYRIDLHACNEEVGRCSAGAFVFSRTKPAG